MDGHSGIENKEVNRGGSGDFQLILSYLKHSSGRGYFVIHASSSSFYLSGLQPIAFLEKIGFQHFQGECKFFHDRCFYRTIAEVKYNEVGFENIRQTMYIHSAFEKFANEGISKLYELQNQQIDILRSIKLSAGPLEIFKGPVEIEIKPTDIPVWANSVKFPKLKKLKARRQTFLKRLKNLKVFWRLCIPTEKPLYQLLLNH